MKGRVTVQLRPGVLDVEGKAIGQALHTLGFDAVTAVRVGKVFEVELAGVDRAGALEAIDAMADRLLANPVMETYAVETLGDEALDENA